MTSEIRKGPEHAQALAGIQKKEGKERKTTVLHEESSESDCLQSRLLDAAVHQQRLAWIGLAGIASPYPRARWNGAGSCLLGPLRELTVNHWAATMTAATESC